MSDMPWSAGFDGAREIRMEHLELSGIKLSGVLAFPRQDAADAWRLDPLATADGSIRAQIADAHLLFDADVTVPIRHGRIDFNDASVEHVGPDSRMGISPSGLYVDAPNGRSYLFQFASPPDAGVEFERRDALLGPWVSDRGKLRLHEFVEGLLRSAPGGPGVGSVTGQALALFDRTTLSGDVQLGDGKFAAPGVQADLVGRAEGRNLVHLHSESVGRGLSIATASLSVRDVELNTPGLQVDCREITGTFTIRLVVDGARLRFECDAGNMTISGLRARTAQAAGRATASAT